MPLSIWSLVLPEGPQATGVRIKVEPRVNVLAKFFCEGFLLYLIQKIPPFSFSKAVNFVFNFLEVLKDNQSQIMASV
ncbi:hypothetical protein HMPREF9381_1244 [Streptococcus sanguinis SK72]|uniref:Uncharacterized protein n=1 Tax=Streptococcus sanguinis SK72 TaxID=888809 RepID=F0I1K3_STRSA|nr:hypothetical protein HMPREF9381_1244 [Streptococcus sanguinis SK72]